MCGSLIVQLGYQKERNTVPWQKDVISQKKQRKMRLLLFPFSVLSCETHFWLLQVFNKPLKQVEYKFKRKRSDPFSHPFILAQALGTLQAFLKPFGSRCLFLTLLT